MSANSPISAVPRDRRPLLEAYVTALLDSNRRVNLVSRASTDDAWARHVAHSLALAHRRLRAGARVADWGTGGGLPAVPLAICFPDVEFIAVDSIAKKTRALGAIVRDLGLENVTVWTGRAETFDASVHYAVSRATAPLDRLWRWTRRILQPLEAMPDEWAGGLLCLKGGDLSAERAALERSDATAGVDTVDLARTFDRPEWIDKYIVHVTPGENR